MALKHFAILLAGAGAVPAIAQTAPSITEAATPSPAPATAQPAADPGRAARTVYDAKFFATYAPATALQMIERVPGFTFDPGDQNIRGFSQAAGNVVIDGQRPSAKSDTLDIVLSRIPANRVVRIEVAPGDQFGSEFTGKPQVANVVLATGGGLSATVETSLYRYFTGRVDPEGSGSLIVKHGKSSFTLAGALQQYASPEDGYDRLTARPSGAQREYRQKLNNIREPYGYVSAAWDYNGGTNKTAHLNGRYAIDRFKLDQYNNVTPATGPIRDDRLIQRYDSDSFEIGGDVTRPLAGGGLKLIGLVTRRKRNNDDLGLNRVNDLVIGGSAQTLKDRREETLARLLWSRSGWNGWNIEIGGETALNRLVSNVDLSSITSTGAYVPINLPIDNAVVKEFRNEAFANAGRALSSTLRMDLGLTYETSRLTVSGDATAARTLNFLKPKVAFDWKTPGLHAQLSLTRTVAQLQFEDFISAAELSTDRVNGGNANLLPQRAWEVLATIDRPFLGDGLIKLELGYNQISLVQDRIPTPDGFDAPGNLGNGRSLIWRGTIDAPLGRFGIKGGRLKLYGSIVDTSVRDPYTGRMRPFSGNSRSYWYADFRQDLGKFAWGVYAESNSASTNYRLDELDTFYGSAPFAKIFAEYRPTKATTITIGARNLLNLPAYRYRTFFSPNRTSILPVAFEERERNSHIRPYVTLKHSFG